MIQEHTGPVASAMVVNHDFRSPTMTSGDRILNKLSGEVATLVREDEHRVLVRMHETGDRVFIGKHDLHATWRAHPKEKSNG